MQNGIVSTGSSTTLESEAGPDAGVLSHALRVLGEFADFRQNSSLCDVTLVGSDGKHVSAHRALLAASTSYFRAMFTGNLMESSQKDIQFPGIEGQTLETLVDFMYSGRVDVNERNVDSLLESASMLQMVSVLETCCKFLLKRLNSDNCLGVLSVGRLLSLPSLFEGALAFVERNFSAVSKSEEFLDLPANVLSDLLTRDGLFVHSETEVFDACIRWLKHEWPGRASDACEALSWVRWPCVLPTTLACLDCDGELQFLRELPECAILLQYAKWGEWHAMGHRHKSWKRLRNSLACQGVMFAMGGETNPGRRIIKEAEKFDLLAGCWESMPPLPRPRRGAGAVIVNNVVYVAGGSDGLNAIADIHSYDPQTNVWSEVGRMLEKRSSVGAVASGHMIYFVGGYDGFNSCLHSVESYNIQTRQHKLVAPMAMARSMCAVASLAGRVYALGGYDGSEDMREVECYNISDDAWTPVAPMSHNRWVPAFVSSQELPQLLWRGGTLSRTPPAEPACDFHS